MNGIGFFPLVQYVTTFCEPAPETNPRSTVFTLMRRFTDAWSVENNNFNFSPKSFDLDSFSAHLASHAEQFKKEGVTDSHFGYIEKFDLDLSDQLQIYMRADLHGDLKSLIENIRSLQEEGLLDQHFRCKPGLHLVFLGDYCDRGMYGMQIIEMLMRLREENPDQVHLIRGNHEYISINRDYSRGDFNLQLTLSDETSRYNLECFYATMSLTTYFGVGQQENREYVQCTHGLFELTMDPAPLLDRANSGAYLPVPKVRELSERIKLIANSDSSLRDAARRIDALFKESQDMASHITAYNWADVSIDETWLGKLSARKYALSARDIRHYLDLSSDQHRVMLIFRGHQHEFQHLTYEGSVLVTTLPVGVDCAYYADAYKQSDRAYIITPSTQIDNWNKRAILRDKNSPITNRITDEYPLTSVFI